MFLQILIVVLAFFGIDETKPNQFGSVQLQASIHYGDEDERSEPVEGSFYLLDESLIESLRRAKFEPVDENDRLLTTDEAFLSAAGHALLTTPQDDDGGIITLLLSDLIKRHSKAEIKTYSNGRSSRLKSIKTGKYYLFGAFRKDGEIFVWDFPIVIKLGENKIVLDQYNARCKVY
jgi:hypothetical protein